MEAASHSGLSGPCRGRNFNGTFMIRRRAVRRSGAGMFFLLNPGGNQVEIWQGSNQSYEYHPAGSSIFSIANGGRNGKCALRSAESEERPLGPAGIYAAG